MISYMNLKTQLLKSDKLLVVRMVEREGRTFPEHYWVSRDELKDTDTILHDPQKSNYFCCKDAKDTDKVFQESYDDWEKHATKEEVEAVRDYTQMGYDPINKHLRIINDRHVIDKTIFPFEEDYIKSIPLLDSAIDKFELKRDIVVHRTVNTDFLKDLRKFTKSGIFHDPAFCSTTAVRGSFLSTDQVHCIINVPAEKGVGMWVKPLSSYQEEEEFLLRRDLAFSVDSIQRDSLGHWVIKLTVAGKKTH